MQENRSFDSYFGTLRGVRGYSDPTAITLPTGKPVWYQPDSINPDGYELPFRQDTILTSAAASVDLSHHWDVQHNARDCAKLDDWLPAHRAADGDAVGVFTMAYYDRADLPFHYALADAFMICDNYHCSVFGPTNPNRLYQWTGTIDPDGTNGGPVVDNSEARPYTWTTYPEMLQNAGVSWRNYQETDTGDDNPLAWFAQFQNAPTNSPLYQRGIQVIPQGTLAQSFAEDVRKDNLAATVVHHGHQRLVRAPAVPAGRRRYGHPPAARRPGQQPQGVEQDRVLPQLRRERRILRPRAAAHLARGHGRRVADGPGLPGRRRRRHPRPDRPRLPGPGVRYLAVEHRRVAGQVYDHTSTIRFMEQVFGVENTNLSQWRRENVGDFTQALNLKHKKKASIPALPFNLVIDQCVNSQDQNAPVVPAAQTLPTQEPGTRPQID